VVRPAPARPHRRPYHGVERVRPVRRSAQYADQRLIQAATDQASDEAIVSRYDYRDPTVEDPLRRVELDDHGAFHIDYLADTGDGFEGTYAMAYLLAIDQLKVPGIEKPLAAADTLIMGGDQCYPQATREEYKSRLVTPFNWALDVEKPNRKVFAIPGNHDWYDGLAAFDSLFCSSRDRLSEHNPTRIGGWQCQQHRSYWAMRLPYNWWIWGTDIQFSKYLDAPQINYFELIARQMNPGDNLIICIAEPSWLIADLQGEDEDENFFKITTIARNRGARICAVIAGDWHHYNRYYANALDVHFITAGGGGSFLHPTHVLRDNISVRWPQRPYDVSETAESAPGPIDEEGWEHRKIDISLRKPGAAPATSTDAITKEVKTAVEDIVKPIEDTLKGKTAVKRTRILRSEAPTCYPSRNRSRLLSLKNLAFPFYNIPFAIGIGLIYWLLTWQFYAVAEQHDISAGKIDAVGVHTGYFETLGYFPLYLIQACLVSIPLSAMLLALLVTLVWYVAAPERPRWKRLLAKIGLGVGHFTAHLFAMFALGLLAVMVNNYIAPRAETYVDSLWRSSNKESGILARAIREALEPLSSNRAEQREMFGDDKKSGTLRRTAPPAAAMPADGQQDAGDVLSKGVRQIVGFVLYPFEIIIAGGLVGGFIWGLYWAMSSFLFRIHGEDAFAALRIGNYRNFLRLRFDRDKLTIYPIGVDKVPERSFWRPRDPKNGIAHNPMLEASEHIDVRLIEKPIVIYARPE